MVLSLPIDAAHILVQFVVIEQLADRPLPGAHRGQKLLCFGDGGVQSRVQLFVLENLADIALSGFHVPQDRVHAPQQALKLRQKSGALRHQLRNVLVGHAGNLVARLHVLRRCSLGDVDELVAEQVGRRDPGERVLGDLVEIHVDLMFMTISTMRLADPSNPVSFS